MQIAQTKEEMQSIIRQQKAEDKRIAFVPTMGALHAGHLSLVKQARQTADFVVVSIFVNPRQFGPNEDFDNYPRTVEDDSSKLSDEKVDLLYLPNKEVMFPEGYATTIRVEGLSEGLCSTRRPQFFDGIATVVTKLFLQVTPDIAIFGEKDYQQLQIIKRLVKDLELPIEVMGGAIIREEDGLAMSSRNRYLNKRQRAVAPHLYNILREIETKLHNTPDQVDDILQWGNAVLNDAGFDEVDYLELRDAENLAPLTVLERPARLFAAAYLGKCRLIDNIAICPEEK